MPRHFFFWAGLCVLVLVVAFLYYNAYGTYWTLFVAVLAVGGYIVGFFGAHAVYRTLRGMGKL